MLAFLNSLVSMDYGLSKIILDSLNAFLASPLVWSGFGLKLKAAFNLVSLYVGGKAIVAFIKDVCWQNLYVEGIKQGEIKWEEKDSKMLMLSLFGIFIFLTPWSADFLSGFITFFTK